MPRVGFEPTIPVFGRAKTIHPLEHTATVMGTKHLTKIKYETTPFYNPQPGYLEANVTHIREVPDSIISYGSATLTGYLLSSSVLPDIYRNSNQNEPAHFAPLAIHS
jgi:hypothetical protein